MIEDTGDHYCTDCDSINEEKRQGPSFTTFVQFGGDGIQEKKTFEKIPTLEVLGV